MERRAFLSRIAAMAFVAGGGWRRGHWRWDDTLGAAGPRRHPDPRPGITAARVVADRALDEPDDEVRVAYAAAREVPTIFDGLACVCSCTETAHHRSLLACFETRHPESCPGCLDEAALVGRLARQGRGLDEVRRAVDLAFGR